MKVLSLLNKVPYIFQALSQMQLYPWSGPFSQHQDRKDPRRLVGVWNSRPYLGGTAHLSRAHESCRKKRPMQVPKSGNSGPSREGDQTKDPEPKGLWAMDIRNGADRISESKVGSFCGASRDGVKGQLGKDRLPFWVFETLSCSWIMLDGNHSTLSRTP